MFKKTAALSIFTAVLCFLMMVSAFAVVPPEAEGAVQIKIDVINEGYQADKDNLS